MFLPHSSLEPSVTYGWLCTSSPSHNVGIVPSIDQYQPVESTMTRCYPRPKPDRQADRHSKLPFVVISTHCVWSISSRTLSKGVILIQRELYPTPLLAIGGAVTTFSSLSTS